MKFSVARGEFLEALSAASRALSARSTLPILSGILIEASSENGLTIQSTDLEISIKQSLGADVQQEGSAVFPGKLFTDIVRSLPESAVSVHKESDTATIACDTSSFSVKTLSPDDFPRFPEVPASEATEIDTKVFASLVSHVSKAVSRDETRPILTGVLVSVYGPSLRMVATDSYRLAVKETVLEGDTGAEMEAVVPGKALDEVSRLASTDKVSIAVAENQAVFRFGSTIFVTRRIEGSFPNWKQLIPKETETTVTVGRGRTDTSSEESLPLGSAQHADETIGLGRRQDPEPLGNHARCRRRFRGPDGGSTRGGCGDRIQSRFPV